MIRKEISLIIGVLSFAFLANAQPAATEATPAARDTAYVNFLIEQTKSVITDNQDSAITLATQARDLALLNEKYAVEKIQPVDMFPHTHHIECVVLLRLK